MDLRQLHLDERGLVVSWLVRILVGVALAGVVLFDVGAIVVNYFTVNEAASEVAKAAVLDRASGGGGAPNLECQRRSGHPVCQNVYRVAKEKGVKVVSAHFDQQAVFQVEIRSTADTLIVGRIDAIADWANATASAEARAN